MSACKRFCIFTEIFIWLCANGNFPVLKKKQMLLFHTALQVDWIKWNDPGDCRGTCTKQDKENWCPIAVYKVCHSSVATSNIWRSIPEKTALTPGGVRFLPFFLSIMFSDCINLVIETYSRLKTPHTWDGLSNSCSQSELSRRNT